MRRHATATLLAALLVATSACVDRAVAPQPDVTPPVPSALSSAIYIRRMSPDSTSADFTVTPSGGTFTMGPHALHFPDSSICDPSASSYGPGEWDAPCVVLDSAIAIHAEVRLVDGKPSVDFTPSLRFVPTTTPDKFVWIMMRVSDDATMLEALKARILWSPAFGQPGVDESLTDATLRSYTVPGTRAVYRRIKHFSGYQVQTGYVETPAAPLGGGL